MSEQPSSEFKEQFRDRRTETFSRVLDASLLQTMSEEERAEVERIVSIGSGDAIETPLLRAAFLNARITLLEIDLTLADLTRRKFAADEMITSIHADASTADSEKYLQDTDLAIIRNPSISVRWDKPTWQVILDSLGRNMKENGMLFLTTVQREEMDEAMRMMQQSGFTPLEGEPKDHTRMTVDDSYTVRARKSKLPEI